MGKKKKKVTRLTEAEYIAYISSISTDAAAYNSNGEIYVPPVIRKEDEKKDY